MNLFDHVVAEHQFHPNFKSIMMRHALGIREVLDNWSDGFIDRDGKFVKEFQTTFNSSFWELYLFAVLKELKLEVDLTYHAPDFVLKDRGMVIEAAIASHAQDDIPEWKKTIAGITSEESFKAFGLSAIRLSNALMGKLKKYQKSYSQLPHVKNKPFVIALGNYSMQDFNLHGDVPLQWLLYDVLEMGSLEKNNGSLVDLGLFRSDRFEEISAVIHSSLATTGKARVLSKTTGDITCHAIRIKNLYELIKIEKNISEYKETLTDGLRLFVNPYARHPIDVDDFVKSDARIFLADKKGSLKISCHPDGDLCMRFINAKFTKDMLR